MKNCCHSAGEEIKVAGELVMVLVGTVLAKKEGSSARVAGGQTNGGRVSIMDDERTIWTSDVGRSRIYLETRYIYVPNNHRSNLAPTHWTGEATGSYYQPPDQQSSQEG